MKALKVAVVIPPEQLPPVAPGAAVVVQVEAGAVTATARFTPKAYRQALATLAEQGLAWEAFRGAEPTTFLVTGGGSRGRFVTRDDSAVP